MITLTSSLGYLSPKREQGSRLRSSEKDLGTYLDLELEIEASTYGSTICLVEAVLNLVLLTPWVRWLNSLTFPICCWTLGPR